MTPNGYNTVRNYLKYEETGKCDAFLSEKIMEINPYMTHMLELSFCSSVAALITMLEDVIKTVIIKNEKIISFSREIETKKRTKWKFLN